MRTMSDGVRIPWPIMVLVISAILGFGGFIYSDLDRRLRVLEAMPAVNLARLAVVESNITSSGQAIRDIREDVRAMGLKLDMLLQRSLPR